MLRSLSIARRQSRCGRPIGRHPIPPAVSARVVCPSNCRYLACPRWVTHLLLPARARLAHRQESPADQVVERLSEVAADRPPEIGIATAELDHAALVSAVQRQPLGRLRSHRTVPSHRSRRVSTPGDGGRWSLLARMATQAGTRLPHTARYRPDRPALAQRGITDPMIEAIREAGHRHQQRSHPFRSCCGSGLPSDSARQRQRSLVAGGRHRWHGTAPRCSRARQAAGQTALAVVTTSYPKP